MTEEPAELAAWIAEHGRVCAGIGTEAPHPARELIVLGDDAHRRVLCPSCAQAWHRALAGGGSRR